MKKILFLMLGLVAGTTSFANSSTVLPSTAYAVASSTRFVMTANQKIKLYVQPLAAKGEISIRDAQDQPIYNSSVSLKKGLKQQFDFSNLGTGTYHLTLVTGGQSVTKTFIVQADPNASFVMQ